MSRGVGGSVDNNNVQHGVVCIAEGVQRVFWMIGWVRLGYCDSQQSQSV